jgi:hypothetical protein
MSDLPTYEDKFICEIKPAVFIDPPSPKLLYKKTQGSNGTGTK